MSEAFEEAPAKGKKKKIVILAAIVLIAGVGGFFGMKMLSAPPEGEAAAEAEPTPMEGAVVDVAELTSTLDGDTTHLARVGFAVVLDSTADQAVVEPRFALLKDAAVDEMARSSATELVTPEGVDDLRARLSARATEIWPDGEVIRVVLTQLVVQ